MTTESAYAHLGNAQQIVVNLLEGLPVNTVTVTVTVEELKAIRSRIDAARDSIREVAKTMRGEGGHHV